MQPQVKTEPVTLVAAPTAAFNTSAAQPADKPPSKVRVFGVLGVLILAGLGFGGRMYWRSQNFVETENAYVAGHVHPISARIAGVVTKVLVDDNQFVKEGQVIAELDPADQGVKLEQIRAQIASVEQQVLQADAQTAQVRASANAAQAQVAQAQAQSLRAQQDSRHHRQVALHALQQGDRGGGSATPDIKERDDQ